MAEIKEWKPISRPQEIFLSLPETIKEGFFGGSAGPGKSECLMMYPVVRKYIDHSRFKALFLRRTYPELKREIIPRTRELYTSLGGKFHKGDLVWEFESGAMIFFGHCENEDDVSKYDSMEINLFLPDEVESLIEWQYLYIGFTRVRTSDPNLPAIIRGAGMPGGIGHSWVKKRFIDPYPDGGQIIKGASGNKRIFIRSFLTDNPKLDKGYAQSLEELPEAEKRAKKYGDWSSFEGQVFDEFRDKKYPDEPDNALHVIEPFVIPDWWPKIVVIDWGFAPPAMTYVGYGAVSPNRQLIIYREQFWQKVPIEEWTPYTKHFIDTENPKVVKICQSAKQDRGQEHTILEQVSTGLGRTLDLTGNKSGSRIAGKMLVHEYLRWKQKFLPEVVRPKFDDERAAWILRNNGIKAYENYMLQFEQPDGEPNLPKMLIFSTCKMMVNAIKSCTYDKKNAQDVAEFPGDDPYDVLRYMCDAADSYFEESESEMRKLQAQQKIVDELAHTNDWNSYYRNIRKVENQDRIAPVRRYRRGIH